LQIAAWKVHIAAFAENKIEKKKNIIKIEKGHQLIENVK